MVPEVSVNRDAIWSFWQACTGKVQHRPLGVWSKALPSVGNYSPFEKQVLACHWTLAGIESLTMSHQVIMVVTSATHHEVGII